MQFRPEMLTLYTITDGSGEEVRILTKTEQAILGGATMIQLREKNQTEAQLTETAKKLVPICHKYHVPLIVNDNYRVALAAGADGVHVGAQDASVTEIRQYAGTDFIIGATAKTIAQAKQAEAAGADYLGVGAVFPSPTKTNAIRITPAQLRQICHAVKIPVTAIGGIHAGNVTEIADCGQAGIAVVSAIFGAEDVTAAAQKLRRILT